MRSLRVLKNEMSWVGGIKRTPNAVIPDGCQKRALLRAELTADEAIFYQKNSKKIYGRREGKDGGLGGSDAQVSDRSLYLGRPSNINDRFHFFPRVIEGETFFPISSLLGGHR